MPKPAFPITELGQFSYPLGRIDWYNDYQQTMKTIHFVIEMGEARPMHECIVEAPHMDYNGIKRGALMTYCHEHI